MLLAVKTQCGRFNASLAIVAQSLFISTLISVCLEREVCVSSYLWSRQHPKRCDLRAEGDAFTVSQINSPLKKLTGGRSINIVLKLQEKSIFKYIYAIKIKKKLLKEFQQQNLISSAQFLICHCTTRLF